jgi:hypothetical protein
MVYTRAMKTARAWFPACRTAARLVSLALLAAVLGGCLLTFGAPLARKVEPGSLVVEAGVGAAMVIDPLVFGGGGYAYVGRSLGKHFEIGVLPVILAFGLDVEPSWSLTVPFKWDPFPYESPVHVLAFAGPSVTVLGEIGTLGAIAAGAAVSWTPTPRLEAYASVSVPVTFKLESLVVVTACAGARYRLNPSLELGAGLSYTYPSPATLMIAGTYRLKPLLSGYGF